MTQAPAIPEGNTLLQDKLVVVTGAAGAGIGGAIVRRCIAEGATVVMSDKHEKRLRAGADELEILGVVCDVTAEGAFESLLDEAESVHGRPVDVLVNNAGLGGDTAVVDMTDEDWARVLDVNLLSAFRGTRAAMRRMLPRGQGAIVNLASVTGWRAEAGQAHYAAAKAGVMALTRCAGLEAAAAGVRVNAVAPTLAMHPFMAKVTDPAILEHWAKVQPQGRAADPMEIANAVAFLASDYASYMTGEVLSVGGQHA